MAILWKYCPSVSLTIREGLGYSLWVALCVGLLLSMMSCDRLSKESYRHLDAHERRKLSSDYLALTHRIEAGTPKQMRLLEKAARINPKNDLVWSALAEPYLLRGYIAEWHSHTSKAVELDPKSNQAYRGYHKLFYFRDYGGALYDFDAMDTLTIDKADIVSRWPKDYGVDYLRALAYYGLKNYPKSKEYMERYIKSESEKTGTHKVLNEAYLYLGMIHFYYQDYDLAISTLEKGIDPYEKLADIHYQIARASFMKGDIAKASVQIALTQSLFEENQYHKNKFHEVIEQLYMSDIDKLTQEIECFR